MAQDSYAQTMAQYLPNSPVRPRYILNTEDRNPAYGTLFGTTHLNPGIAPQVAPGAPRPFAPGEYIENASQAPRVIDPYSGRVAGSWSSEVSETVEHPTKPGKYTNVPSVWLVNGVPKRLTRAQAIQAARQSGLDWPEFDSAEVADKAAADRETNWGNFGRENAAQAPPLWNKAP